MRILITGSEGTLGKVLKAELRSRGHEVFGCDLQHCADPRVIRADINEYRQLENVFQITKPDFVYSLAAEFGRLNGEGWYETMWRSNTIGHQNVIELCLKYNAKMIFASSSEAYGDVAKFVHPDAPFEEGWLDRHAADYHNQYALSKATGEKMIRIAKKNRGLRAVTLRYFNAFGPGEEFHPYRSVVCLFVYRLLKGEPITVFRGYSRVFMAAKDWSRTVANVVDNFDAAEQETAINVGGEEYCSVEHLKDLIIEEIGGSDSEITYLDAEKANVVSKAPDNSRAKKILGHNPKTSLKDGIRETARWMRDYYGIPVRKRLTAV
jgi:dTDP-glucose 4,6-dehydratase